MLWVFSLHCTYVYSLRIAKYQIFVIGILKQNRTYIDSLRMAENRWIPNIRNILVRPRTNWWVMARSDFHIRYFANILTNICLFRKFGSVENQFGAWWRIPGIYEYTDSHITCSPILAQCSRLFSENLRMCGSAFTLLTSLEVPRKYSAQVFVSMCQMHSQRFQTYRLCKNAQEQRRIFGIQLFSKNT